VFNMNYAPERPQSEIGAELVRELNIHPRTNCSTCHR